MFLLAKQARSCISAAKSMLRITSACLILLCITLSLPNSAAAARNLTLPHQHPRPQSVVQEAQRRLNESLYQRRSLLLSSTSATSPCQTGNPIDDCWVCDPNWASNRQQLANCALGFGREAGGGRDGELYVVTDSSDGDPSNPKPGTLRHAAVQPRPLWIVFSGDMQIRLHQPLHLTSFKTLDGRGAHVEVAGGPCLIIRQVTNIIIHNLHIHDCAATGGSDGDGISIIASSRIWVDHCALSKCEDGLIDVTEGSTAVTLSNNHFSNHDKVMLLGHSDDFLQDSGMQVSVLYNRFGERLVQRMPRCRHGYFHIANNDYTSWGLYAVGGSAGPTINSQGNRYIAPSDPNVKEVTRRLDASESEWSGWNWRSEGDMMVNGAFFVPSGAGLAAQSQYDKASSVEPRPAALIEQITLNAGVLAPKIRTIPCPASNTGDPTQGGNYGGSVTPPGGGSAGGIYSGGIYGGGIYGQGGMIFRSGAAPPSSPLTAALILEITVPFAVIILSDLLL